MSLPIPLSVRLRTNRGYRDVTADVGDLTMRWTDPGGYQSAQVSLSRPLYLQPAEVAYYGDLTVFDGRHGGVVWDGRQEDPGRSAGTRGPVWDLAAVGGQAHTRDRTVPLVYVDQPLSNLERVDNATPSGNDSVGASPADPTGITQCLVLQLPQATNIDTGARIVMRYPGLWRTGQKLARIDYRFDNGRTDVNYLNEAIARTNGSLTGGDTPRSNTWSTAGGGSSPRVIGTNWTAGRNTIEWRIYYTGAGGPISDEKHWAAFSALVVMATRYTATGVEQLTAAPYTANAVFAHEVVADLIGRLLTSYDGATAVISPTTHPIDQLAYHDGVDSAQVLDDLMKFESAHTWRVWERLRSGKFRFEWVPVPTEVRYEADVTDGYDGPGSAEGLYDRVTVRWRDSKGRPRTTERSASVPLLDAAGLTRQGSIDLGSDIGSVAAAERAGDMWLAEHRVPPNGGRLTIARPILDLQTGRMVMPWEIKPGLIRVRGVAPHPDALNDGSRDGSTVFRIVAGEFRSAEAATTLELDSYAQTTLRILADTRNRFRRVHRR